MAISHTTSSTGGEANSDAWDVHADHNHVLQNSQLDGNCSGTESSWLERGLTVILQTTGLLALSRRLQGSQWPLGVAWALLCVAGTSYCFGQNSWGGTLVGAAATTGVYALLGPSELVHVMYEAVRGSVTIHLLTTCAVFGTIWLGCAVEGALLLALFATANQMEMKLTGSAKGNLRSLWASVPKEANRVLLLPDGTPDLVSLEAVPADTMSVGSYALVRAGEQVPLDGVLVYGNALVNLAHITGESMPLPKLIGEEIPSGAAVTEGVIVIRTTMSMEDSTPARIARLTAAAQTRKPEIHSLLERVSQRYAQVVLGLTACCVTGLVISGCPLAGPGGAAYRAFGFLAAAAPCALMMTPLAYVAAIGACAQRGVLVRGGKTLDELYNTRTVALDKTGTLTTGIMRCVAIEGLDDEASGKDAGLPSLHNNLNALALATALERMAVHPIAQAVVEAGEMAGVARVKLSNFRSVHGQGVEATTEIDGTPLLVRFGKIEFACELAKDNKQLQKKLSSLQKGHDDNVVAVLVSVDARQRPRGEVRDVKLFRFADTLRGRTASAVQSLRDDNHLEIVVLTGDNAHAASAVARMLDLEDFQVKSGMLPEDKMAAMRALREAAASHSGGGERRGVVMVGDGLNDAPALAEADVGVAIVATPSEAAAAVADVLLLHKHSSGISMLPYVLRMARRTRRVVQQNLALASLSVVGTCTASLAGWVPLWLTVLLHEGTTLIVALNSMRLLVPEKTQALVLRMSFLAAAVAVLVFPVEVWFEQTKDAMVRAVTDTSGLSQRSLMTAGEQATGLVSGTWGVSESTIGRLHAIVAGLSMWACKLATAANAGVAGVAGLISTQLGALFAWPLSLAHGMWECMKTNVGTLGETTAVGAPAAHGPYQAIRSAGAGLLAGVLHTLTGPDHLAALAPLTIGRSRAQSTILGGLWGCGHNTGQILFGLVFLVLRERLSMNMDLISQWGQGLVGVTLVLIGILGFKEAMDLDENASASELAEAHEHSHRGGGGGHGHSHSFGTTTAKSDERKFSLGTYFTGIIHGLQPDALLVLLPALALPSGAAAAYLGTFLVGTVVAMASYTFFLGVSSDALAKLRGGANTIKRVSGAAALVAFGVGVSLLLSATLDIDILGGGH
eukprot:CAMPEP_0114238112 /NCGR_PEP_ID=MMETSP0058-20121206/7751_1 /TAXON_ID=36894 /ORGANISM="Pyramimonas parkeae, CCMP726" /LENGTH=1132 /DNA_ID=CAMNT_0001350201 /DNA_START=391 /DNA_END=3789 /DNA_ORIENTATION=+